MAIFGTIFSWAIGRIPGRHIAAGLIGLAAFAILFGAYWHYQNTLELARQLEAENRTLESAVQEQEESIRRVMRSVGEWQSKVNSLEARMVEVERVRNEARKHIEELSRVLAEHDLGDLARSRPGLIERRVNSGTLDTLRVLREQSAPGGHESP